MQHLIAQLPEELDLKKGDEVIVTGEADDGWLRGECRGRSGIFPPGFVSFIPDEDTQNESLQPQIAATSSLSHLNTTSHRPVQAEVEDLTSRREEGRPHGIANYDFQGQQADELTLYAGQTVYLFKHINAEWMEGETDTGHRGIFPTSFIQIVVDCVGGLVHEKSKDIDLLLDFDPLVVNDSHSTPTNVAANGTSNQLSSKTNTTWMEVSTNSAHASLDSFIARNLNLLGSTSSNQACEKQRPASWTQTLTGLQIEYSTQSHSKQQLPAIPPRRQETQSVRQTTHNTPVIQPTADTPDPEIGRAPIVGAGEHANNEPCGSIVSGMSDSGASQRKSYTRPAPPPPVDSPNLGIRLGISRQESSDSVGSHFQPLRPAPLIPSAILAADSDGKCLFYYTHSKYTLLNV